MSQNFSFIIDETNVGKRLDKFIAEQIIDMSRTKLKELIVGGALLLNGKPHKTGSYKLMPNDNIEILVTVKHSENHVVPKQIDLNIVFEDEHLMVINKQSGLTVHPGAGNKTDTLVNGLLYYLGDTIREAGDPSRPGIVHRLDKDTSGLMIVAKTEKAHRLLSKMIAEREVERIYQVLVYGSVTQKVGMINANISRSKRDPKKRIVTREGGKTAVTHFTLVKSFSNQMALLQCKLETGRTHQIRVHMDYMKTPVVGDQTYGKDKNFNLSMIAVPAKELARATKKQMLHSSEIAFIHPITEEPLRFTAELSGEFARIVELLQNPIQEQ